jgi:antitoxin (DNA-binding transcriptional repressor) of toxin-antitoxin stability system
MREATFTEFRNQAKRFFDLVERGEIVRVLRNGKPIAEVHPVPRDIPSWKKRTPKPLTIRGSEVSRIILQDRGE